ncbi:type IV secretion system protein [uncultured Campylobacter sp.]|uniref:virB8 family protein n=1 Tax=uncultured Campylobacter sp. TaxID=218934 RepID=UPI002638077E|nr:type IV secretion system protein [uncultured Campylobacter sp.]
MLNNNDEETALSYVASIRYLVEKSNKRAWLIAIISAIIALASICAIAYMTPLKQSVPYVIRVDNTTGMVDIITSVKDTEFSSNEALDKYFTSLYVKTREGYHYNLLTQDYTLTQILSSPQVAQDYVKIYEGANARQEVLKNDNEVSIDINSVVLGESADIKTATIRFNATTSALSNSGKNTVQTSAKVATLSYEYSPADLTTEDERLQNPLGFKVTTYRIDDEIRR